MFDKGFDNFRACADPETCDGASGDNLSDRLDVWTSGVDVCWSDGAEDFVVNMVGSVIAVRTKELGKSVGTCFVCTVENGVSNKVPSCCTADLLVEGTNVRGASESEEIEDIDEGLEG